MSELIISANRFSILSDNLYQIQECMRVHILNGKKGKANLTMIIMNMLSTLSFYSWKDYIVWVP
jgi:hypothetical protein